ncbi:hypothetical protein I3842_10G115900 [Carya illinoinensis]|uniref:non-specific serine/threonine protein kinase n=1 Tax=Carya illinoinensis TaxID=32201 RepID=A0A922DYB8_CARIL|nr:hypothetical protein I3842_10G115900 [Carya illinoinensis]
MLIWYPRDSTTRAIWVANRNKPLKTTSGILTIPEDGNLVILDEEKTIVWSSHVTGSVSNMSARLLDTGNLVLQENTTGLITWESFQHPSDSWLGEMKLDTINATTPLDPAVGTFSSATYSFNLPEWFIWNGSSPYWRRGPWNGMIFIGIRAMKSRHLNGFGLVEAVKEGSFYFVFGFLNKSSQFHYVLNAEGNILETSSMRRLRQCGAYRYCNTKNKRICSCLEGFKPNNIEEWNREDWTSGCVRTPLQCMRGSTGGKEGKKDGFLKVKMMKTPSLANWSSALEDRCGYQCLEDCSCIAYAYVGGIGFRLAYSDLDRKEEVKVIFLVAVMIGIVFMAMCTLFLCRWRAKRKGGRHQGFQCEENIVDNMNQDKLQELPVFSLKELASATNNCNQSTKLGQGGFGPVYKVKLSDGQEIAIKRPARTSGQGLEEFMNEVVVISKLQHRNLVRLLGKCVEGEEKLLVYEYMPNKSLDAFLFDPIKQEQLDSKKCFNIIEGIGRGLLYLHRDSSLKIIHRDLKASNILLDEELNPKISEFGISRIFGGNEDQANTKRNNLYEGDFMIKHLQKLRNGRAKELLKAVRERVFGILSMESVNEYNFVGRGGWRYLWMRYGRDEAGVRVKCRTLLPEVRVDGYMSPEYAMEGFGVLLLEMAWKMWNIENLAALVDPKMSRSGFEKEILRCIHVRLLCVQ